MSYAIDTIPYPHLRALDRVVCGGRGFVAWRIRRRTAGFRRQFDKHVATHTGLLVDFHGQLLIAEMLTDGLSIDTLERYLSQRSRYIISFRRSPVFDDEDKRERAQAIIAYVYRERLNMAEYDRRGVFSFVNKTFRQDPHKWYCSEFDCALTAKFGCTYPHSFNVRPDPNQSNPIGLQVGSVSPHDLQVCGGSWRTLTDDDFGT